MEIIILIIIGVICGFFSSNKSINNKYNKGLSNIEKFNAFNNFNKKK